MAKNKTPVNVMADTLSTLVVENPVTDTTESITIADSIAKIESDYMEGILSVDDVRFKFHLLVNDVSNESDAKALETALEKFPEDSIEESDGDIAPMVQESDRAENIGATTAEEHNAAIGHNSGDSADTIDIPKMSDADFDSAIKELKLAKATAKGEISAIRTRIYLAELRLLIPAMEQAYGNNGRSGNSNFLVKLIAGAGLSGPVKRALSMTISNLINVKDGRLVLDPMKTPPSHVSEKTDALLPVWDESRWKFLKQVYAIEVTRGQDPISDSWNDVFPSPEKTRSELREGFAAQIKTMGKKGLTLQDMMAILQEKMKEGNLTE